MIVLDRHDKLLALDRMIELRDEMMERLGEMQQIIQEIAGHEDKGLTWERARSYWYTQIENNLMGGMFSMCDFDATMKDLKEVIDPAHEDDCDCVECTARREPGGLDYDPSGKDNEAERAEAPEEE